VGTPAELLERAADELDLVVLASPAHTHHEQGMAALEAGAHLVIDKPFVPTVLEAKQLVAKAEQAGRLLAVFQNRRWDGDFLTIRKLISEGRLGDIHRFESTFERWGGPTRDRWQDKTPAERGGGITYDLGSHLVDQALQLFGPAELDDAELLAVREGSGADDDAFLSLRHASGVRSHLTMSRAAGQSGPRFRVLGSKSAYTVYGLDGQEPALRERIWPGTPGYGQTPETEWGLLGTGDELTAVPTVDGAYPDFYAGVAAAIRDGAPSPVDPRDALEVVRILERAHVLAKAGA
jgi:predicted dehydrogenase